MEDVSTEKNDERRSRSIYFRAVKIQQTALTQAMQRFEQAQTKNKKQEHGVLPSFRLRSLPSFPVVQ